MLEAVAEKTRKFHEHRVKQRKKQLEKKDKQRRNQSLRKIKPQASSTAANEESKFSKLSDTPIAKRTRSALHSVPVAKRLCDKKTVHRIF
ncbi:unnamed protein product [Onchocerca flexuosa]|uniref:Ribosome biogenesis protein slx9-like n=1 Tax=Onchocerca flexuosa TaxID=387005 RepID=A0A183HUB3_9BILA|nr:unnamed protein product [Onchocerca flexuosa]